jgi:hypothetical protein
MIKRGYKALINISNKLINFRFQDMAERKGHMSFIYQEQKKKLHTTSKLELDGGGC